MPWMDRWETPVANSTSVKPAIFLEDMRSGLKTALEGR